MSWQDRDYADDPSRGAGRPGGDWQGIRPTFDNPMTWSVFMGRVAGIAVRVHVIFLLFILIRLARAGVGEDDAFALVALQMACLFIVVLVHEFGHCIACRRSGGSANEILMWPLGGLAFCRPPQDWRAHFLTAAGGPLVNVVILFVLGSALGLITGEWLGVALPNPFVFHYELATLPDGRTQWWLLVLYALHDVSFLLLLFNLLPMFPLDGGRLVQAALWAKHGYVRSMRLAVYTGYIGAIALGVGGAIYGDFMLVAIAIFGGVTCYVTVRQLEWTETMMGDDGDGIAASLWGPQDDDDDADDEPPAPDRREQKRLKAAAEEQAEVDRILAKIADRGMDSLNGRERNLLRKATERKRREEEGG